MAHVLAIDAGTTGVRTVAVDETGAVVEVAARELTQHYPRPGWVEQDPVEIWNGVQATLAEVAGRLAGKPSGAVAGVAVTNQRETAIAWDRRSARPLHRAIVWQDRRTAARCASLQEEGHLDLVRALTGLVLDPYFSATKFEWLLTQGGVGGVGSPGALALGTVDSWLLWLLTGGPSGGIFATDATNASRTMLFDIERLSWSDDLCQLFGIPPRALAEVRPSCGRLGVVSADPDHGLPALAGVAVSGIAGDQQAALFGQACFEPGLTKATYGTGSFVLSNAGPDCPAPCDGLVTTVAWDLGDHVQSPLAYALEGSTFASGAAVQWLRDGLGVISTVGDVGPLAASVADAGGLCVVPAFSGLGSPWWDPSARGTLTGITGGAGRAQLARAVVEAMAFQVRDMVDAMEAGTGVPCRQLRADGGASQMDLLLQLQADQVQAPVVRPRCIESTAVGAAMLAGLGEGVWGSLDDLARLWQPEHEATPRVERAVADAGYAAWLRAVERARHWAEQ